ncbi:aminotransferase class IV [Agrococcus sp. SL85]|uniref:aminotransferase class IV n=1 Tax=Agrococcus sp. SL85 TaxID=2995141 RepID=UPI00226C8E12|nr:aminotransferase class IV [Agrococcus sp. SL85]WAC65697.1 aminotransferase class IV [Agrococcus sp. SL85]
MSAPARPPAAAPAQAQGAATDAAAPSADAAAPRATPGWAWTGSALEPVDDADAAAARTLAADSWLVVDGRVLALDRHAQRFQEAVAAVGGDRLDARSIVRRAASVVPDGRWSPRVDLTPEGLRLRLRPAPPAQRSVEVVTAARDPRAHPLTKGPDLVALAALQAEESARVGTAVEPILAPGGRVAEGAWSALLWWRGDALHVPAAEVVRLPSVTAAVLAEVARIDGVRLVEEAASPDDLAGCEVWLANALRGIRGVARWHGGPELAPPTRVDAWRARLDGLRTRPRGGRS